MVAISEASAAEPRRLGLDVHVIPVPCVRQLGPAAHAPRSVLAAGGAAVPGTAAALTREKDPCTCCARAPPAPANATISYSCTWGGWRCRGAGACLASRAWSARQLIFCCFQPQAEDIYPLMDVFVLVHATRRGTSVPMHFYRRACGGHPYQALGWKPGWRGGCCARWAMTCLAAANHRCWMNTPARRHHRASADYVRGTRPAAMAAKY